MGQFLIWHPSVHASFHDELVFYYLSVGAFHKETVYQSLQKHLVKTQHTSYRIYRVFGSFDIILRVWVAKGEAADFARKLSRELDFVADATSIVVEEIPHHWKYKDRTPTEAITRLTPDEVNRIQLLFEQPDRWENEPIRTAEANCLVRRVDEIDGNILFFTGITHTDARKLDAGTLLQEIYDLFHEHPKLDKTAVYRTTGTYAFVIKAEAGHSNFFEIGEFVTELNHKLAVNRCRTETSVVLGPKIHGREEIGKRSFQQVAQRDIATLAILPEVYDDEDIQPKERSQIESWIRDELVPYRDELTEAEFQGIQACLRAVVTKNEMAFLSAIMEVYGPIERELRRMQGAFIGKLMGAKNVVGIIAAALARTIDSKGKVLELLSLGDRLTVYVHVIKSHQLSTDEEVVSSWDSLVHLRDQAAHFSERVFPAWQRQLPVLIQFVRRYKKLLAVVRPIADDLQGDDGQVK